MNKMMHDGKIVSGRGFPEGDLARGSRKNGPSGRMRAGLKQLRTCVLAVRRGGESAEIRKKEPGGLFGQAAGPCFAFPVYRLMNRIVCRPFRRAGSGIFSRPASTRCLSTWTRISPDAMLFCDQ